MEFDFLNVFLRKNLETTEKSLIFAQLNVIMHEKHTLNMTRRLLLLLLVGLLLVLTPLTAEALNSKTTVTKVSDEVALMTDVDYIITDAEAPFDANGSVNIVSTEHAVLIFRNIKPSLVIKNHLSHVFINGEPAKDGTNCQVKMYAQGAIVFPYPKDIKPLTVYSEPNFEGEAVNDFGLENSGGFMNTLTAAKLNNRIRSFRLKRGYMVTFALGTGGWGYSRCFIADQEDLEIATMPANMDSRISSYRVFQWQNAQKKGLASDTRASANEALNTSWCYTWSTGENRLPDTECVPNHIYEDWPSPSSCGSVTYSCHMKTNNEPGNSADDHPQSVETVLNNWQNLMRTGLRLCSETSHDGSWNHLQQFIKEIDARGWRCDLLDLHCYWASGSFWSLENYYNNYGRRPIWISEWVWGASWNNNGIFGEAPDGRNSFSAANQQKCYSGTKPILDYLNSLACVERYAYWNSEADCSKIYKDGTLSTLGKYYASMQSGLGYNASYEKVPTVVYSNPSDLAGTYTKAKNTYSLKWVDNNGDMADSIVVECKLPGSSRFVRIATLPLKDKNSANGATYTYTDTLTASGAYFYRVGTYPIGAKAARYSGEVSVSVVRGEGDENIRFGNFTSANMEYSFSSYGITYDELPAVILGPISTNNATTPLCHHLQTIKKDGFQYRFLPWSLAENQTMSREESAAFLSLNRGNGTLGGLHYEANQIAAEQMDSAYATNAYGKVNNDTAYIHFNQPFNKGTTPVVFVNVLTSRETYPLMWKVFDVSHEGFKICLCREYGRTEKTFFSENVFYLAIEQGQGQLMDDKIITVGLVPEAVGGITARPIEFGDSLASPLFWGEPQTANETRAAITRYSTLSETGVRVRRTIDSSEPKVTGSAMEDFGWMVISDGTLTRIAPVADNDNEPMHSEWFTLDGRRVASPSNGGLYIRRTTFRNGTSKTTKIYHKP